MILSLAEAFTRYFSVQLTDTNELKQAAYRLRYRVYCEEFAYESPHRFPDGLERDDYDDGAYQGLIIHRESGHAAACLRLIPALDRHLLPMEEHCNESLDHNVLSLLHFPRTSMCEISRLSVDPRFRRRRGEEKSRFGHTEQLRLSTSGRRTFPLIGMAAIMIGISLSVLTRRYNIFAMVEPFIPKMLWEGGIPFYKIGREINYHGLRAPYYTRTENTLVNMKSDLRDLYDVVFTSLAPYFDQPSSQSSNESIIRL